MRRHPTLRSLAVGAGAAAVLMAAASPALSLEDSTFDDSWEQELIAQGYSDVSCYQSELPGGERSVFFEEKAWGPVLDEGSVWALVVLKDADDEEGQGWRGYGEESVYQHSGEEPFTHVMLCQGHLEGVVWPTDGAEPTDGTGEGDDPGDGDGSAGTGEPTGPPVETDGITSSGPDVALLGGATLVLAGAGAAGFAMRRRDGAH